MHRKALIGTIAILAGFFVATHSRSTVAQPAKNQETTPVGVWDLKGVDDANTKWIATMVLTEAEDGNLKGHIDWLGSNAHCGREHVTASYDVKTRILKMVGTQVEFSNRVVRATYRAELTPDGSVLEKGKWSDSDPIIPGSWSAERIRLR